MSLGNRKCSFIFTVVKIGGAKGRNPGQEMGGDGVAANSFTSECAIEV